MKGQAEKKKSAEHGKIKKFWKKRKKVWKKRKKAWKKKRKTVEEKLKKALKRWGKTSYFAKRVVDGLTKLKRKRYYRRHCLPLPVEDKLVIFEAFLGRSYACSPKAIYEAMVRDPKYDDYQFIWVFRNVKKKKKLLDKERTTVVKYKSYKAMQAFGRAKYWVTNWRLSETYIKKDSQICIQTWHGTPLKKIGIDLNIEGNPKASQKTAHKRYLNDAKKYDYFVSPSAFCTQVFRSAFGLDLLGKEGILIETGYPRNDFLCRYTPEDVVRIRKGLGIPEGRKVLLYAPTWRDNQHELGVGNTFDMTAHFTRFLEEISQEYTVLLRLHYLVASKLDVSKYEGRVLDCSKRDDINELYVVSDLLITDYSSVFFDYANLKRPILFYMFDLQEYESSVRDFYFDLKELPGPIIQQEEELIQAVRHVEDYTADYQERYQQFNAKYTAWDDGEAARRVIEACIQ